MTRSPGAASTDAAAVSGVVNRVMMGIPQADGTVICAVFAFPAAGVLPEHAGIYGPDGKLIAVIPPAELGDGWRAFPAGTVPWVLPVLGRQAPGGGGSQVAVT